MSWKLSSQENGVLQCTALNGVGVVQACSTKKAGNMALHTGADPELIIRHQTRFLHYLGLKQSQLVGAYQVHGLNITVVDQVSSPLTTVTDLIPDSDALITKQPGVVLAVFTADCLPLFFYDPVTPAVGVAHAGWRGTLEGIARLTLQRMQSVFGTDPAQCLVGIGPAICANCFQVGEAVAAGFREVFPETVIQNESGYYVDLVNYNRLLLEEAGVEQEAVLASNICTCAQPEDYFSHRASKTTGRMMGIIALG